MQVTISGDPYVDGGFFTMHRVPNTNVFIIVENNQIQRYDSCSCEIHKVRKFNDHFFCNFCPFSLQIDMKSEKLFQDESGTPQCSPEDDCECPCHAPAQYDFCENQLPPNMFVP